MYNLKLNIQNLSLANEPALKDDEFFHSKVIKDLDTFKSQSDIIVANRLEDALKDVEDKIYTRDIFREN